MLIAVVVIVALGLFMRAKEDDPTPPQTPEPSVRLQEDASTPALPGGWPTGVIPEAPNQIASVGFSCRYGLMNDHPAKVHTEGFITATEDIASFFAGMDYRQQLRDVAGGLSMYHLVLTFTDGTTRELDYLSGSTALGGPGNSGWYFADAAARLRTRYAPAWCKASPPVR
jgi:hypothetical protein